MTNALTSLLLLAACLLCGCPGAADIDQLDLDVITVDTGDLFEVCEIDDPCVECFHPVEWTVEYANFGYEEEHDYATSYWSYEFEIGPTVTITFRDIEGEACSVNLTYPVDGTSSYDYGFPRADWSDTLDEVWFGFNIPIDGRADVRGVGCDLNPDIWYDSVTELFSHAPPVGIGIGVLDSGVEDIFASEDWMTEDTIGGGFYFSGRWYPGYASGWQVDSEMAYLWTTVGTLQEIPGADMDDIEQGVYSVNYALMDFPGRWASVCPLLGL